MLNPIPIVFDASRTNVFLIDSPHLTEPASSILSVISYLSSNRPALFIYRRALNLDWSAVLSRQVHNVLSAGISGSINPHCECQQ